MFKRFSHFIREAVRNLTLYIYSRFALSATQAPLRSILSYFSLTTKIQKKNVNTSKNINRLMSEELLSNDRRVETYFTTPGFAPLTSRSLTRSCAYSAIRPFFLLWCNRFYISNNLYFGVRTIEITQKWRTKSWKSYLRSQRMLEKRKKNQKICIKQTNTFTIIAMNFVQEQLNITH